MAGVTPSIGSETLVIIDASSLSTNKIGSATRLKGADGEGAFPSPPYLSSGDDEQGLDVNADRRGSSLLENRW